MKCSPTLKENVIKQWNQTDWDTLASVIFPLRYNRKGEGGGLGPCSTQDVLFISNS